MYLSPSSASFLLSQQNVAEAALPDARERIKALEDELDAALSAELDAAARDAAGAERDAANVVADAAATALVEARAGLGDLLGDRRLENAKYETQDRGCVCAFLRLLPGIQPLTPRPNAPLPP
jgi:hypothetical protein